ncbi:MAG: hypothetical protein A3A08_00790 [Candidatus Nealsonbacteria bacterium RIFCSPLOWO2_01_FULL_41_9]|uniref:Endolytic murein transglycosylase n=1 Tax=Candidatus Nealsonbacteria bacterium RIFCSPLOWO2_01_FULL_41_9 TaxID=1801671 RepID=A0A1G2ECD9_9BACT|nr:MAG: hypothetical protein A3A08_00790 [Candidatus Nealsonbacteria bacterium RIFCSPLOWO2_01_FULL_41_9]
MRKYLILFIFISSGVLLIWGVYGSKNSKSIQEKLFSVEKGQNLITISKNLEKEGLIINKFFFEFYVFFAGSQMKLQAGRYYISPAQSASKIAKKIISGDIAKITLTVPEGWNKAMIEKALDLELPGDNLEGYLFPDTYHFPIGVSGKEVVETMTANFSKKTAGLKITKDIIIMASIIEREVRTKEDMELVSGILWKRLEIGMALQVDAKMWTYENRGLPPAPISNPGLESILAAINPKTSPYWYYLSKPDGTTVFSKTLEEHNIARVKYLK